MSYSAARSKFMSFGSVSIVPRLALAQTQSDGSKASTNADLRVGNVVELGRFPPAPFLFEATPAGFRRAPQTVTDFERAAASLRAEVARRIALARRKEVVIFIHGYKNTFDDAAVATGDICRSMANDFVCVVLTWPAGGSKGISFGYNVDRESGEFAVADVKKAIRIISTAPGVERVHLIAHSRGTDVLAAALQQLIIETFVGQSSIATRFHITNIVLFAPDIDLDVASSKMFGTASDPELPMGTKARPFATYSPGPIHLTVYSSPSDRALGISAYLFGSSSRLGQLDVQGRPSEQPELVGTNETLAPSGLADFIEFEGSAGFIGHSYFRSDPAVRADLVALIRDRRKAGDPGRALVEIKRPFWRIDAKQEQVRTAQQL
jgi:esterase/lipase superfamily enzyme